jgi:hypothetical protein
MKPKLTPLDQFIAARVADKFASAVAALTKKKRKVQAPDPNKLDKLLDHLLFAVKVLRQKQEEKHPDTGVAEREVKRHMDEYNDYVRQMGKALSESIPDQSKEAERAADLLRKVDFFSFGRATYVDVLRDMPVEVIERDIKKTAPIWRELQQLLKGQQLLFASIEEMVAERFASLSQKSGAPPKTIEVLPKKTR